MGTNVGDDRYDWNDLDDSQPVVDGVGFDWNRTFGQVH